MSFTAKEVEPLLQGNPDIQMRIIQDLLEKKHQVKVSLPKLWQAKKIAMECCEELVRANPGTTIKIDVQPESNPSSPTRQLRRIYVFFGSLKEGFNLIGRELIGLDGAFMKGPYPGQILFAVGVDGNNGIYPLPLPLLKLKLPTHGFVACYCQVLLTAEHRYCVNHIHKNMKKTRCGDVYKNLLWRYASATSMPFFDRAMDDVKALNRKLYDWLKRSLQQHGQEPTFQEVNVKKIIAKSDGPLTSAATSMFETIKDEASQYNVLMTGSSKYRVMGPKNKTVVDVHMRTCSCRKWDLTGMLCVTNPDPTLDGSRA
ncbi:uncharacterized protein LOC110888556 [Helianthus annuus]|uniref:uncharacterized protein LOC110888556 n=1 Tax=Helianthus annuus TaxID=4232 RepID=UPI000B8FC8CA|nr:uncharacterized protein LOC110888556 [Helianthus annuus]